MGNLLPGGSMIVQDTQSSSESTVVSREEGLRGILLRVA